MTSTLIEDSQLEFEFENFGLGTKEEARIIFEAVGDRFIMAGDTNIPEGWTYLGAGGTRTAYLSPSGVVYKLLNGGVAEEDDPTYNDIEHLNFRRIEREGKLPNGWKVPRTHLHAFRANYTQYNYRKKQTEVKPGRVVVMACEYIKGQAIGGWDNEYTQADMERMERAFAQVGLSDCGGANAIKGEDGYHYIIDAAEDMLPEV